jgi:hypothetical protein
VQIERISALLQELEDMSCRSSEVPSAVLTQARASICKVEEMLGPRDVGHSVPPALGEDEVEPQPHVDREVLDRLYLSLNPHP